MRLRTIEFSSVTGCPYDDGTNLWRGWTIVRTEDLTYFFDSGGGPLSARPIRLMTL